MGRGLLWGGTPSGVLDKAVEVLGPEPSPLVASQGYENVHVGMESSEYDGLRVIICSFAPLCPIFILSNGTLTIVFRGGAVLLAYSMQ